jgi:hypothetical protein
MHVSSVDVHSMLTELLFPLYSIRDTCTRCIWTNCCCQENDPEKCDFFAPDSQAITRPTVVEAAADGDKTIPGVVRYLDDWPDLAKPGNPRLFLQSMLLKLLQDMGRDWRCCPFLRSTYLEWWHIEATLFELPAAAAGAGVVSPNLHLSKGYQLGTVFGP